VCSSSSIDVRVIVHSKMVANAGVGPRGNVVDSKHENSYTLGLDWAE
jgi:hypothetical protein